MRISFLCLVLILALPGCASPGDPASYSNGPVPPSVTFSADGEYLPGAGDRIRITVLNHPGLSGEFLISPSGYVEHPLLRIRAAGRPLSATRQSLARVLGEVVNQPRFSVSVADSESFRFYIGGQVRNPGSFPMAQRISLAQAIALAGGRTPFASGDIVLVRPTDAEGRLKQRFRYLFRDLVDGRLASGSGQVFVERGDYIYLE